MSRVPGHSIGDEDANDFNLRPSAMRTDLRFCSRLRPPAVAPAYWLPGPRPPIFKFPEVSPGNS